ncbi:MAG: hypothetical protein LBF60_07520 [Treponema sp.]|nr:hypothetical protein [Treponema sp.]
MDGDNNFLPKPGVMEQGSDWPIRIIETAKSWDIYKLYERYHDKGKLASLSKVDAGVHTVYDPATGQTIRYEGITVAGNSAAGLYGANNQPSASFPYRVKGEVLSAMRDFAGFENLYEYTGDMSLPINVNGQRSPYKIKNFATESLMPDANFLGEGARFFRYAPGGSGNPTGAIKIMRATAVGSGTNAKYLDLRDLPLEEKINLGGGAPGGEIAFASVAMLKSVGDPGLVFPYSIGYANDNSGTTKLVGTTAEGFDPTFSSIRNTGIIGVLELQDWTEGAPPATKFAADFPASEKWTAAEFNSLLSIVIKPYANQNPALDLIMGGPALAALRGAMPAHAEGRKTLGSPVLAAVLDDYRLGRHISEKGV